MPFGPGQQPNTSGQYLGTSSTPPPLTTPEGVVIDVSLEAPNRPLYIVTLEDIVVYGKWLYIQQHVLTPGGTHIYRAAYSYVIL